MVSIKNKDFILAMIISICLGLLIVSIINNNDKESVKPVLIDSLSDDFYKKTLDSFPFDHSKIPDE